MRRPRVTTRNWALVAISLISVGLGIGCGGGEQASEPDTVPPATVGDLRVQSVDCDRVSLEWTAPGDDGTAGRAASYDLRYSHDTITEGTWASAAQCASEPAPKAPGQTDGLTLEDLTLGTTYYFAVATKDEQGNESEISNIANCLVGTNDIAWVYDGLALDLDWVTSATSLSANWAGASCSDGYEYAIGTSAGGAQVAGWTSSGSEAHVTHQGLALVEGETYYFSVRALIGSQYTTVKSSDGAAVDSSAPTSAVDALPAQVTQLSFDVSWAGSDAVSSLNYLDIQVRDGAGPWTDWLTATPPSSAIFNGMLDHAYFFRSRAYDMAGNVEAYPTDPDATTVITCAYRFSDKWAIERGDPGEAGHPHGLTVDKYRFIYVTEIDGCRVQRFTPLGIFNDAWGTQGTGDGEFSLPCDIALDDSGYVYVVDVGNKRVQKFTWGGTFAGKWGTEGTGDGEFMNPRGIAVDDAGYVYVTDMNNGCVQKFTRNGAFVARWGEPGTGEGQMAGPSDVAVGPSGTLYVAEFYGQRIQEFTPNGQFIREWGRPGAGAGEFYDPQFLAIDAAGHVFVSDYNNHRIQKFTSDGMFLTSWGDQGSSDGQFRNQMGLAVDDVGYVYVGDYDNSRVQKFEPLCP